MDLRLTRRALADLDLDPSALAGGSAQDLVDRHPLIAAFVERRSQSPRGKRRSNSVGKRKGGRAS